MTQYQEMYTRSNEEQMMSAQNQMNIEKHQALKTLNAAKSAHARHCPLHPLRHTHREINSQAIRLRPAWRGTPTTKLQQRPPPPPGSPHVTHKLVCRDCHTAERPSLPIATVHQSESSLSECVQVALTYYLSRHSCSGTA